MMYNVSPCEARDEAHGVRASIDGVILAHPDSRTRTGHGKVDRIRVTSSQRLSILFGGLAADLLQRPLWSLYGVTERHPSSARRCHPGGCRSTLRQRRWLYRHSQRVRPRLSRTARTTAQGEIWLRCDRVVLACAHRVRRRRSPGVCTINHLCLLSESIRPHSRSVSDARPRPRS
jgi:hypothetical protein